MVIYFISPFFLAISLYIQLVTISTARPVQSYDNMWFPLSPSIFLDIVTCIHFIIPQSKQTHISNHTFDTGIKVTVGRSWDSLRLVGKSQCNPNLRVYGMELYIGGKIGKKLLSYHLGKIFGEGYAYLALWYKRGYKGSYLESNL